MADEVDRARLDVQSLPDTALVIYEAIATLEYTGRRASLDNIASATSLSRSSVDKELAEMARRGLIQSTDEQAEDGPVYVPAQRGWSAAPDQAEGHQMF
jgi:predicted transcriptional regulator